MRLYYDESGTPVAAFLADVILWESGDRGCYAEGHFYTDAP